MNGHERSCRCDKCVMETRIKVLEERVEMLMSAYRYNLSVPLKSVPDPEFNWGLVDDEASTVGVDLGDGADWSVESVLSKGIDGKVSVISTTIKQQIESDRAQDDAYFKERAKGFRTAEIPFDDQPFVIGGEG